MAADTIQALTRVLGKALLPLRRMTVSNDGRLSLLELFGYEPAAGLETFLLDGLDLGDLVAALEKLDLSGGVAIDGSGVELGLHADAFQAVTKALNALAAAGQSLRARLPANYLARTRIHERLPRQLLDWLLISELRARSAPFSDVLLLLGVIRVERHGADPANFRTEYTELSIAYERIAPLLTNPMEVLTRLGWGTATFNASLLLKFVGQLLSNLASDVHMRGLPRRVEERLRGAAAPEADGTPMPQLLVGLIRGLDLSAPDAGFTALGLRASVAGASDGGIALAPFVRRTKDRSFALAQRLQLALESSLDLDGGVVVNIRPGASPSIQVGVTGGGAIGLASGGVLLRFSSQPRPDASFELLRIPGGSRLEARELAISTGVRPAGSSSEFVVELALRGARFVLSLEGAGGLLSALFPKDLLRAELDLALGWARGRAYLRGSAGLEVAFPVHLSLGPISLETVHLRLAPGNAGTIPVEVSASVRTTLGPLELLVERIGLRADFAFQGGTGGNLGPLELGLGFKVPSGIGVLLEAGPVSGGGHLELDPAGARYGGALQLKLPFCKVSAYGIYEQVQGRSSFVAVLGVRLSPGIQLGFGFTLTGVGGIVGLNRRADTDVLRERLASGAAGNVLFADDPVRTAPALLGDLAAFFPPVPAGFLVGPTLQIGWMSPLVRLDLGIMIELPGPSKIVILGSARAMIGASETLALLFLRMDVLGSIDFQARLIAFDAQLVSSHALGIFQLSGGMAFRLAYGDNPYVLLSVGGFHPRFDPGPLNVPRLPRVGASFNLSVLAEVNLRLEMYLAFTSNTLQAGARVEASMQLGPLYAQGHFLFDALIQFKPFLFEVDFSSGFDVRVLGVSLTSVDIVGRISGPGPIVVHATGSVRRFGIKIKGSATFEIGEHNADAPELIASVVKALEPELARIENLRAEGDDTSVVMKPNRSVASGVWVRPRGALIWEQKRVPLKTIIDRFEGAQLQGSHELHVAGPANWTVRDETDWFSPGRFSSLDAAASQTLNNATFQELPSGLRLGLADDVQAPVVRSVSVELRVVKWPTRVRLGAVCNAYLKGALSIAMRERTSTPLVEAGKPIVSVKPETFAVVDESGAVAHGSVPPFQAFQLARESAGHFAVSSTDGVLPL